MLRLVGAVDVDADIVGLPLRKTGQFDAQIVEMQHKCEHERERLTQYINDIPDSFIRQIFRCKFLDCMTWEAVAGQLPGVYTGSGVRKKVTRYLDENPEKSES